MTILGLAGNLQAATVIVDATTKLTASFDDSRKSTANGGAWTNGVRQVLGGVWNTTAFTQRTGHGGYIPQVWSANMLGIDWNDWYFHTTITLDLTEVGVTDPSQHLLTP